MKKSIACLMLAALLTVPAAGLAQTAAERPASAGENKQLGSLYLRCDGQPNNMSGAETFGRLVAITLVVGLLAGDPEAADPSKRLFGAKGVEACSRLIDDPASGEHNGLRRIPLILGRAVHRIEAKDYQAAIDDIGKARTEAQALGLIGNPYFDRSMGLSFNMIEAEARLRLGDAEGAREVGLRDQARMPFSFYATVAARPNSPFIREMNQAEENYWRSSQKIIPSNMYVLASRLAEAGRFSDAAVLCEQMVVMLSALDTAGAAPHAFARAAIANAMAGNWEKAAARAIDARKTLDRLAAAGKPDANRQAVVEMLDFYDVLKLAHEGKTDDARMNFAARSVWISVDLGFVLAATDKLRLGARPEQLRGSMAKTSYALWSGNRQEYLAQKLETDANNRTLWSYILPYARIKGYENLSKDVWRTDKPRLISEKPIEESKFWFLTVEGDPMTQPDALLLHAARQAMARGFEGFTYFSRIEAPTRALVQFGHAAESDIASAFYIDARAVIADLRQIIPPPEELSRRRTQQKRQ